MLAETVRQLLGERWSPEQVAHELRELFVGQRSRWLCKETIYQAIYDPAVEGREWLGRGIARCLDDGAGVVVIDHSGTAGARLARTRALELIDGRCEVSPDLAVTTRVHVVATNSAGERIARDVDRVSSDALLRDLLDAGWHIESVTR